MDQIPHNNMWEGRVSRGQPRPLPGERNPSAFKNFGTSNTIWQSATKFCMAIKLDRSEVNVYSEDTPVALTKTLVSDMTGDLCAVANLIVNL